VSENKGEREEEGRGKKDRRETKQKKKKKRICVIRVIAKGYSVEIDGI
jgi:hypothetical protein